jgi:hypothetical protein
MLCDMPIIDRVRHKHIIYNYLQDNHVVNQGKDFNYISVVYPQDMLNYRYRYTGNGYMVGLLDRFSPLAGALIHFRPASDCGAFEAVAAHGFEADESILSVSLVHKWVHNNPSIITGIKSRIVEFIENASKSDINITAAFIEVLGPFANLISKLVGSDTNISDFLASGAYFLQQGKVIVPERDMIAYDGIEIQDVDYTFKKTYITITDVDGLTSIDKVINELKYLSLFPGLLGLGEDPLEERQVRVVYLGPNMIGGDIASLIARYDDPKYREFLVNGLAATLIHEATKKTTLVSLGVRSAEVAGSYRIVVEHVKRDLQQNGNYTLPNAPNIADLPVYGDNEGKIAARRFAMSLEDTATLLIIALTDVCKYNTRDFETLVQRIGAVVDWYVHHQLLSDTDQNKFPLVLYKNICNQISKPANIIKLDDTTAMNSLLKLIGDAYNKVKEIFSTVINGKYPFYVEWDKQNSVPSENNSEDKFFFYNRIVINKELLTDEANLNDNIRQSLAIIRSSPSLGEFLGTKGLSASVLSSSDVNFNRFLRNFGVLLALPPGGYHFIHNYKAVIIGLIKGKPCLKLSSPSDELEEKIYKLNYYGFAFRNINRPGLASSMLIPLIQYMIPQNIQVENSDTYIYSSNLERYGDFGVPLWTRLSITMMPFNDWIFFFGNFVGLDKLAQALRIDPDEAITGTASEQPGTGTNTDSATQSTSAPTPTAGTQNSSSNTTPALSNQISK